MKPIKNLFTAYLQKIILLVMLGILLFMLISQALVVQYQAQLDAADRFTQIEQVLAENEKDLASVEADLRQTYLNSADIIAYMIQRNDDLPGNLERMREIAALLGLDEICIFDQTGTIVAGTDPNHFGMTFDSGEQMRFFKPMLTDKSLRLSQDRQPRASDGKLMQYSATWSQDGTFIVEVGKHQTSEQFIAERYSLSYVFTLLKVKQEATLYAIDPESEQVLASTAPETVGKTMAEIGLAMDDIREKDEGFHARVNGELSYCVFDTVGGSLIGRTVPAKELYGEIPLKMFEMLLVIVLIALILVGAVTRYMDKLVVRSIQSINEKFRKIAAGDLEQRVELRNSIEFSECSDHINEMVESLSDKLNNEYQYQAELTEAIRLADSSNRSKSAFLFNMSHDIRTPMNAILGFSSMAEKHIDDKERVLDCLKKLNSAGDHLLRLINDVLDMARIESGKMTLNPTAHSIPDALAGIEAVFSLEMRKKTLPSQCPATSRTRSSSLTSCAWNRWN